MKVATVLAVGVRSLEVSARKFLCLPSRPYKLLLELTGECNSRCQSCSIWKKPKRTRSEPLEVSVIERLFRESGKDLLWLALSGGEITLYDDFPLVIQLAKRHCPNLRLVTFTTNGLLPTRALAWSRTVMNAGFDGFFTISLDGDARTHDSVRGVKGNYALAWETYNTLRAAGVPVHFGMTIGDYTEPFIVGKYATLREHFKAFTFVHGEGIYGQSNCSNDASILRSLRAIYESYHVRGAGELVEKIYMKLGLRFLEQERSRNVIPCGVGRASLDVRPDGSVALCMYLPPIGNIKSNGSLRAMLTTATASEQMHQVDRNECHHCWMNCYAPHSILLSPLHAALSYWRGTSRASDRSHRPTDLRAPRRAKGAVASPLRHNQKVGALDITSIDQASELDRVQVQRPCREPLAAGKPTSPLSSGVAEG